MIGRAMRPVLFVALLLLPAVAAAGFEEGVDAYLRGEYARARTEWTPLAERGNAQAAYNLGRMRELGLDGPSDAAAAARWYLEAAERGHAEAQRALAQLLAEGKGELDEPTEAAFWLTLAARAWPADSPARRLIDFQLGRLKARLGDDAFAEAEARAAAWSPRRD